jgi:8-amino-7-oxononanoate synthase
MFVALFRVCMPEGLWLQFQEQIAKIKAKDTFRYLKIYADGIDFFSNDYLGIARNNELSHEIAEQLLGANIPLGSTGSRLISGQSKMIANAEEAFAEYFQSEDALLFASGYHANTGLLQALGLKGYYYLLDEQAHASLKEGARLSLATKFTFKHNDLDHLEHRLANLPKGKCIIVTESIFSMDGDMPPLAEICKLKDKYNAVLVLDEAHSTGILGHNGRGLAQQLGLIDKVDVRVHTFGKAWGHAGAVVAGTKLLKSYLVNASIPFIYTTAPTPIQTFVLQYLLTYFDQGRSQNARQLLSEIIKFWNTRVHHAEQYFSASNENSPIQYIKPKKDVRTVAAALQKAGFQVKAILPPTVRAGTERVRINLHSYNTQTEIELLLGHLTEIEQRP